jgi:Na+/H+ antiporter NhaD/arsenite permease-like protein
MSMKAPPPLVFLMPTVVMARVGIVFVVHSPVLTALAWAALLGALSVWALRGHQGAARAYAYVCLVLGADTLIQLSHFEASGVYLAAPLCWAALVIGAGLYVLRSASVQRFLASAPSHSSTIP